MSTSTPLRTLLGGLLLAAPLALSLPGVRAEADPAASPAPAPMSEAPVASTPAEPAMCPVPDPEAPNRTAQAMLRLQQRLAAEGAMQGDTTVVLNGRGYNYGAPPSARAQLDAVRREAAAQAMNGR